MNYYRATPADVQLFQDQGYVLVRSLFMTSEVEQLSRIARGDERIRENATSRADAKGGTTTLSLSNELEDDVYSRIVASRRVASNMSLFLKDEVYHYHHKMMLKEPRVGGAWEWHQDYGELLHCD